MSNTGQEFRHFESCKQWAIQASSGDAAWQLSSWRTC